MSPEAKTKGLEAVKDKITISQVSKIDKCSQGAMWVVYRFGMKMAHLASF